MLNDHAHADRPGFGPLDAELVNASLGAVLARIGIGVIALDARGRVIFSNPAADALLGGTIAVVNRRLRFRSYMVAKRVEAEVARLLDRGEDGGGPKPIVLAPNRLDQPLAMYLMAIPHSARSAEPLPARARVLVLVVNPSRDAPPDPLLVREMLGLTLGEARIAALVGSGLSPRKAAERLGLAVETARSVLKRVFEKTGVSRQSELVALMSRLLLR
jgi:DNA-binding CsgD family transcriptional regulator